MQSSDGSVEVAVVSPHAVEVVAEQGELVRVQGVVVAPGSDATVMLPIGHKVSTAVQLCGLGTHARALLYEFDQQCNCGEIAYNR